MPSRSRRLVVVPLLAASASLWTLAARAEEIVAGVQRDGATLRAIRVARAGARPAIAVLPHARWSADDSPRDGAGELAVLMTTARLLAQSPLAGLVAEGDRGGRVLPAMATALRRAACMGVPVVRVASGGFADAEFDGDFVIAAGARSADDAQRLLAECLLKFGATPPAANPAQPTRAELAAIDAVLKRYRDAFAAPASTQVAAN